MLTECKSMDHRVKLKGPSSIKIKANESGHLDLDLLSTH